MSVYLVQHIRFEDDSDQNVKICGIYSSEEEAQKAIHRFLERPGFMKYPTGFHVTRYEVGEDEWSEGFGIELADE